MPSINNKTHSVAYTGSYAVILLYIFTAGTAQLHDDGQPRPSSIALFKYVTRGGPSHHSQPQFIMAE